MISLLVAFGLFHGLFFLPVMLSIFGGNNGKEESGDEKGPKKATHDQDLNKKDGEIGNNGSANPGFQEDSSV